MSNKNNSRARKKLKEIFGDGCFLERMGVRKIKGVRKIDRMITYHHLRKRSDGGRATPENGANLAWENHQWLHSLPEAEQEQLNQEIRKWKLNFLTMQGNGEIYAASQMNFADLTKDENCIIINLEKTTPEQYQELFNQKEENKIKQKFNRSKTKKDTQNLINEELYEEELEL